MTKYLPWFLFLTGIQSYAGTGLDIANPDSHPGRDFIPFTCKVIKSENEKLTDHSGLIELRKDPTSLSGTLRSNLSFNLIIKPHQGQAAIYINGGIFAVLKKDEKENKYTHINNHYDQRKGELHQSIYRVNQIELNDIHHQFTARLKITKRTISDHSVRPHSTEYLTRTYQCVSE